MNMLLAFAVRGERFRAGAIATAFSAAIALSALTGCGMGSSAAPSDTIVSGLHGQIYGGQQAVTGSNVYLFATNAGSGGSYTTLPTLLATATTNAQGGFTFTTAYTCTAAQNAYVLAAGGNPGLTAGTNNKALVLMAALGTCGGASGIGGSTSILINEITTVAAAYTLAGFLPAGGAGLTYTALTGTSQPGVSTSTTNTQGLNDAFANAANMVNFATGLPYTVPPANSTGSVPAATIISLANSLSACVNTDGGTAAGSGCNSLFAAATPPTGTGISAPTNTLQAILDIAEFPGNNVTSLFNVTPAFTAFGGGLSSAPNDWTLGISYTATNLVSAAGLAIDNADNIYTVGFPTSPAASIAVLEFSPQGALLSPVAGWNSTATGGTTLKSTDNVRQIKIDPSGNVFFANGNVAAVYEYVPAGTATAPIAGTFNALSYATVDATKNNWGLAVDTSGNVFSGSYKASTCVTSPSTSTSYCGIVEFPAGNFGSPVSTFSSALLPFPVSGPRDLAIDSTNKLIYGGTNQGNTVVVSNYAAGTQTAATLPACAAPYGIALDKSNTAYVAGFGNATATTTNCVAGTAEPSQVYVVNNTGLLNTLTNATTVAAGGSTNGTPFSNAFYDVVDGVGNVFITNSLINGTTAPATSSIAEYSPSFNTNAGALLSNNLGFSPGATYVPATTTGTIVPASLSGGSVINARSIAIDRSGAMWVLNPGTAGSLVQIFGVAAQRSRSQRWAASASNPESLWPRRWSAG